MMKHTFFETDCSEQNAYHARLVSHDNLASIGDVSFILTSHRWFVWAPSSKQAVIRFDKDGDLSYWPDWQQSERNNGSWVFKDHLLTIKDADGNTMLNKKVVSCSIDCIVLEECRGDIFSNKDYWVTYLYVGFFSRTFNSSHLLSLTEEPWITTYSQLEQFMTHASSIEIQNRYASEVEKLEHVRKWVIFGIPSLVAIIMIFAALYSGDTDVVLALTFSAPFVFFILVGVIWKCTKNYFYKKFDRAQNDFIERIKGAI